MGRRFWLWWYGTPNLVGSTLALVGLALFFAGLIKSWWYLIVPGLYAIGVLLTPVRHIELVAMDRQLAIDQAEATLERLWQQVAGRLSPPVEQRLQAVMEAVRSVLPGLNKLDPGDRHVHEITSAATRYLPEMLESYLNLPPAYARLHPVRAGKTARDLLLEQLTLLESEMRAIAEDLYRADADRLMAHGRFLEEKFAGRRAEIWWGPGSRGQ